MNHMQYVYGQYNQYIEKRDKIHIRHKYILSHKIYTML